MSWRAWTYPEQRDLIALWADPSLTIGEIAERLRRSEPSVLARAKGLSLAGRRILRARQAARIDAGKEKAA